MAASARRRTLRTTSTASVCVLATGLAALVAVDHGYTSPQVQLNDSGVWVTIGKQLMAGRFNDEAGALDGMVPATGMSAQLDVLQHDDLVVVADPTSSTVSTVDPAAMTLHGATRLPDGSTVLLGGDVLAIAAPGGTVWGMPAAALAGFSADETEPLVRGLALPEASATAAAADEPTATATAAPTAGEEATSAGGVAAVAVGPDGTVAVAQPGQVLRFAVDGTGAVKALDPLALDGVGADDDLAVTVVGDDVVVLDRTTGLLHLPGGRTAEVDGAQDAELQTPGDAAADVVVATSGALLRVPLDGSKPSSTAVDEGGGSPAVPLVVRGCAYGAWSGGAVLRDCPGTDDDYASPDAAGGTDLKFRTNRGFVVLNDSVDGGVWLADQSFERRDDWEDVVPQPDESGQDDDQPADTLTQVLQERSLENRPPVAQDDSFGVRAGRTTLLPVLENDSDPDGDVITVSLPNPVPSPLAVQVISDGLGLQATVPDGATGTFSFQYRADDGRGGTADATVTLTVRDGNEPPAPIAGRQTTAQVRPGQTVSVDVLDDWRDPDGDVLFLAGAQATTEGDAAWFTADGTVTFKDNGTTPGPKTVDIQVSDGIVDEPVQGTLTIEVLSADRNEPPVARPDHAATVVGQPVVVQPLDNDTDPEGDSLSLGTIDGFTGADVATDADKGIVTFTASTPGAYYGTYVLSDGPNVALGLIRIDVTERQDTQAPPVAVRDRALLPAGGSVLVDVLANDSDPGGGVLVVQSVDTGGATGVTAAVVDHAVVRVTATGETLTRPVVLTYTVSNGLTSATGEIVVVPLPTATSGQPPITAPDEVTVRANDLATVDVLANDSDPDGLPITVTAVELSAQDPPAASPPLVVLGNGTVRVLAGDTPGTYAATYTVSDPAGRTSGNQVIIHVKAADEKDNSAPVPRVVVARTLVGSTVRIPVPVDGIDPDGDSVELLGLASAPVRGIVTGFGEGWIDYRGTTPGTDTFTYQVRDRYGAEATGTVMVGVAPATTDSPPVAVDDELTARPGRTVAIAVLANDSDPDGDQLSLVEAGLVVPDGLTATVESGHVVVTTPEREDTYTLQYQVADPLGATATGTVRLTVTAQAPAQAPVAIDDLLTLDWITKLANSQEIVAGQTAVAVPVLDNDEDPDGSPSDLRVVSPAAGGDGADPTAPRTVEDDTKVQVTLLDTPQVVPYTVQDADRQQATAFIRVPGLGSVLPTLVSPLPDLQATSGQPLAVDLTQFVLVAGGGSPQLTRSDRITALNGAATATDEHTVTFTSVPDYYGAAAITFEVAGPAPAGGGSAPTAWLTIPITVVPSSDAPPKAITPPPVEVALGEEGQLDLAPYASDPNGDALTWQVAGDVPAGFTARVDGSSTLVVGVPGGTAAGTTGDLALTVTDGQTPVPVTVTLRAVASTLPLATVSGLDFPKADAGKPVQVSVLDHSTNPYPDTPLTVTAAQVTGGTGTVDIGADGKGTVTPAADFVGTMTVRFDVQDKTKDASRTVHGTVTLTVRDVPDAPGTPTTPDANGVRSHTVVLQWAPPNDNGAPITGYRVTVNGPGGGTRDCPTTTCEITGLTNAQDYTFTVVATNEVGSSLPSPLSAAYRPDAVPDQPAAPALTFGDGQLTVAWDNREYGGERSPIDTVTLEISPAPTGPTQQTWTGGPTSLVWTGLANGTAYQVRVKAHNGAGDSEWSAWSAAAVPAGVPDAPGQPTTSMLDPLGSQAQLKVAWAAPASDHGDAVKSYSLQVFQGGAPHGGPIQVTGLSYAIALDTSETTYTFQVTATNKAGTSAASAASAPRQAVVPPGVVGAASGASGPVFQATGENGTLELDFTDAAGNGARADQVRYQYSLNGGAWTDLASDKRITGLVNGTKYTAQVRAVSTVDGAQYAGPASAAKSVGENMNGTWAAPFGPLATPNVWAHRESATSIRLHVDGTANGCLTTYVTYKVDGAASQLTISSPSTSASTEVVVGNGYSQTHSIEAWEYDTCGPESGHVSASATTDAPPAPSAWVSFGGQQDVTGCSGSTCLQTVLNVSNFSAGTYDVECQWSTNGTDYNNGNFVDNNVSVPANGSVGTVCTTGTGVWVRLVVNGYTTGWAKH